MCTCSADHGRSNLTVTSSALNLPASISRRRPSKVSDQRPKLQHTLQAEDCQGVLCVGEHSWSDVHGPYRLAKLTHPYSPCPDCSGVQAFYLFRLPKLPYPCLATGRLSTSDFSLWPSGSCRGVENGGRERMAYFRCRSVYSTLDSGLMLVCAPDLCEGRTFRGVLVTEPLHMQAMEQSE